MLAANFSDPENARTIFLAAGGLIVLALALVGGTVWWWRSSAVEHPVLGPLEVMGSKPFLAGDDDARREILQSARHGEVPADDELVLHESFDDVFPEGEVVIAAPVVAPMATMAHDLDPFDPFGADEIDDGREEAADADDGDLDAQADDIWGSAPGTTRSAGEARRSIDPGIKSDDDLW